MAFLRYSLLRALIFVIFFLVAFYLLHFSPLTAAVIAVACAFLISFFFLRGQRDQATAVVADKFAPNAVTTPSARAMEDNDAEDSLIDANPGIEVNADRHSKDDQPILESYEPEQGAKS